MKEIINLEDFCHSYCINRLYHENLRFSSALAFKEFGMEYSELKITRQVN